MDRVEQLQEISNTDAIAEGIQRYDDDALVERYKIYTQTPSFGTFSPTTSFFSLWDSINGAGAWEANPWVWAVSFKRVE